MSSIMFEPCYIGGLELRNRFIKSSSWDASADSSGAVTDASVAIFKKWGKGGIGLIDVGFTFISAHGQAVPNQYGVHSDDMVPGLRRLTQAVHEGGGKVASQIVHAGISSYYLADKGAVLLAMSKMPEMKQPHREMTEDDIEGIIGDFAAAAVRSREAGFDAVQLHYAHGFLMGQAASTIYNHRMDRWGGSAQNRRRLHLEVIRRVRKAIGSDFPLFIKYGVMDDQEGGLTLDEGIETAKQMVAAGIDAIEISSGIGRIAFRTEENGPMLIPFRERTAVVKRAVKVPVILVGGIRSLETAEDIVMSGDADMVSMAHPFIREPHLVARWQRGETAPAACITCDNCRSIIDQGEPLECWQERRLREHAAAD